MLFRDLRSNPASSRAVIKIAFSGMMGTDGTAGEEDRGFLVRDFGGEPPLWQNALDCFFALLIANTNPYVTD